MIWLKLLGGCDSGLVAHDELSGSELLSYLGKFWRLYLCGHPRLCRFSESGDLGCMALDGIDLVAGGVGSAVAGVSMVVGGMALVVGLATGLGHLEGVGRPDYLYEQLDTHLPF